MPQASDTDPYVTRWIFFIPLLAALILFDIYMIYAGFLR